MVEMSDGEMVMDDRKGLRERSTACGAFEGRGQCTRREGRTRERGAERTLRALRRASMDLLRPWSSEMWPETAERSAWKVERNEARSDRS